ncbi:MAG: peptidylprolyl isomerase [Elusimicrobia bacterium]|nr:peptidylprolyl isomerase [Elusimicrobiota bacterium]
MSALTRAAALAAAALALAGCRDSRDGVVARVGPLSISQAEFQGKLVEVAPSYQNYVATPNGRRQFLDILIREKLILAAAQASDVSKSVEFRMQVERLKAEEAERVREGRDYLLTRLWLEDLRQKGQLKVGEEEIRDYMNKHPLEVRVRNILLASPVEAEEVANKARAGANFAALAKQRSLDAASAADGGLMPPALYGEIIIPDLEDIIFRMRVGEIGGPIKSKFGYHVLKKEGERKLDPEACRERVARLLEKRKLDLHLQDAQQKYPVEVVDEQFK